MPGLVSAIVDGRRKMQPLHVAAVLCVLTVGAHAQTHATIARGQEIAERLCAGCHAMSGGQGSIVQGTAVPSFRALANGPYRTPESLQTFIMTPRHPMPAMPLDLAEIRAIVDYIQSLK